MSESIAASSRFDRLLLYGFRETVFAGIEGLKPEYIRAYAASSEPLHYTILAFTSAGKNGNAPRDINCLSPGYANWEISLFKSFPIRERVSPQFWAEALNKFNNPQFRAPNMAFKNANLGKIT